MTPTKNHTGIALISLTVLTAWLFVPQISGAFLIKHHFATLGALGLTLALLLRKDALFIPTGWLSVALSVWIGAALASTVAAGNAYRAGSGLIEIVAMLLLLICVSNFRDQSEMRRNIETGILVAACGVALFALKQYFLPNWLDPGFHALGKMKIYSTLGNPSLAAIVIMTAVPSAIWHTLKSENMLRALYAACTAVLLAGLLVTQSRSVLAALGVMGIAALLWMGSRTTRRRVLAALAAGLAIAIAAVMIADLPPALLHSIKGRLFIWQTTWSMMLDHPVSGIGLGQFGIQHMEYQGRLFASGQFGAYFDNASVISEGHNEFLNCGALAGIPGMAGFTLLCGLALWHGWRSDLLKNEAPQFYLALVGYLFTMQFISLQSYPATIFFFWLVLGVVLAIGGRPWFTWIPGAWARRLMVVIVLGLLCAEGMLAWKEVQSGLHEARGDSLLDQHDTWLAEKEYSQALAWNGHVGELRKKYATVLFMDQRMDEALHHLERARHDSGDPGISILRGEILASMGRLDQAADVYREIATAFPNMVGAHFVLGQIYLLQGERALAEAELYKVLDITPSPFNLNLTHDKVDLQKRIEREYFREHETAPARLPER